MKLINLKQNLDNLYFKYDIILCGLAYDYLKFSFGNDLSTYIFLSHCYRNNIRTLTTTPNSYLIRKVHKECYNIIPNDVGKYE